MEASKRASPRSTIFGSPGIWMMPVRASSAKQSRIQVSSRSTRRGTRNTVCRLNDRKPRMPTIRVSRNCPTPLRGLTPRMRRGRRARTPVRREPAVCQRVHAVARRLLLRRGLHRLRASLQPGTHGRQHRFRARVQEPVPRVRGLPIYGYSEFTKSATLLHDACTRSFQLRRHPGGDGCLNGSDRTVLHHDRFHHAPSPTHSERSFGTARDPSRRGRTVDVRVGHRGAQTVAFCGPQPAIARCERRAQLSPRAPRGEKFEKGRVVHRFCYLGRHVSGLAGQPSRASLRDHGQQCGGRERSAARHQPVEHLLPHRMIIAMKPAAANDRNPPA